MNIRRVFGASKFKAVRRPFIAPQTTTLVQPFT